MLRIGLTGGIASGKSHVLRRLGEAGFQILDLDAVARDVMAPGGTAHGDIARAFGAAILAPDGSIDRKALGRHVFADTAARRRLEAIVHPRIREAEALYLSSAPADSLAVIDAALLVETGQHLRFARLVVVFCDPREQLRRLMARDGLSEASARARLEAQMPSVEKRRFGHFVIDNSGALAETDVQVDALVSTLRTLAADRASLDRVSLDRAVHAVAVGPRRGPLGLDPIRLLEDVAASAALDLTRTAARLVPPHDGPWYLAAPAAAPDPAPESLAIPVALWSAAQRPGDGPFAIAVAASLARLTHRDPSAISGAVLGALAALHFLTGEKSSPGGDVAEWIAAATAWAGQAPPPSTVATVSAAIAHAGRGEAAARAAAGAGMPDLARALAGGQAAALEPHLREVVARVFGPGTP